RLSPYEHNAKLHPDSHVEQIANSIKEFTFLDPIAVDEKGEILEGHGRLLAAQKRGDETVPVIVVSGLTDAQKVAYRLAHNKLTMNTGFDFELLKIDFEFLQDEGFDLDLTGFNELELSFLDEEEEEETKGEGVGIEQDEIPEDDLDVREGLISGSIWQLGSHFLMCGDCTIGSNAKKLANAAGVDKVTLLHADPPYGMGKEKDGVSNDNLYGDKLDKFQMQWWQTARLYLKDNASAYIWGNAEDLWRLWYKNGLKDSERLTFRNQIIWDKKHGQGMQSDDFRMYPTVTEHCLFFMLGEQGFNNNADNYWEGWEGIRKYLWNECEKAKIKSKLFHEILGVASNGGGMYSHHISATGSQWMLITEENYQKLQAYCQQNKIDAFKREYDDLKREWYSTRAYFDNTHDLMTDVWQYPRVKGEDRWSHATPKPVDMIGRIIKSSCPENEIVLEPFLGSGTTLIACEQLNRKCIGFEISEKYCEIILTRWEKLTGKQAVKYAPKPSNEELEKLGF
ncbi:MAG: site-specific DNA-methyltransferase, partial [Dolichospermum sp.]